MRKMSGLLLVLLVGAAAQAQRQEPGNAHQNRVDFQGYTILLQPLPGGYGYDILQGRQLVLHQRDNPFTGSPRGLARKDDAFKVAQWQIRHLNDSKAAPQRQPQRDMGYFSFHHRHPQKQALQRPAPGQRPPAGQRVPPGVAKELNIRLH